MTATANGVSCAQLPSESATFMPLQRPGLDLFGRQHAFLVAEQRPCLALAAAGEQADAVGAALGVLAKLEPATLLGAIDRGRIGQAGDLTAQGHVDRRHDLVAPDIERLQRVDAGGEEVLRLSGAGGIEAKEPRVRILCAGAERAPSAPCDVPRHPPCA